MKAIRYIPFVGRLMISLPFALSGLGKLAAIGPTTEMIRTAGLPLPPLALALSIAMEVGGGLLLVGFPDSFGRHCARTFFAGRCGRLP
jgi:putative oxidoreductase